MDYFECLKKFKSNEEISFNFKYTIPFEKLIPENFEDKINKNNNADLLNIDSSQLTEIRKFGSGNYGQVFICKNIENGTT